MQAAKTNFNFRQSPTVTVDTPVHADLYYRGDSIVAAVLWRGNESEPFMCIKDSPQAGISTFSLVFDDDVPKFERRAIITDMEASILRHGEQVVGVSFTKIGEATPHLAIAGNVPPALVPEPAPRDASAPYDANDMDAAVEYSKQTRQLFRDGKHAEAFAHYQLDPLGGASAAGDMVTQERFVSHMWAMRDVQGDPLFQQPDGYRQGDLAVGMKVQLGEDQKWERVRHIIDLDSSGIHVMVEGSTTLHKDTDLFASFHEPTSNQYAAVLAFSESHGRAWKDRLMDAWTKGDYGRRGVSTEHAALLQQVRNECGPEWLANTTLDRKSEVAKDSDAEAQYLVSVHSESWDDDAREAGEPAERSIEVDNETLALDELVLEAKIYGIDSVSSPSLDDPYVWFKSSSPTEDAAHFEDGMDKYFTLHIHEVDGKEPTMDHYAALAEKFGINLAPRHEAAADIAP